MTMSMYPSPDKMKMSSSGCFPGRYSPSYRGPDQMRRCMGNPSVSEHCFYCIHFNHNNNDSNDDGNNKTVTYENKRKTKRKT